MGELPSDEGLASWNNIKLGLSHAIFLGIGIAIGYYLTVTHVLI